MSEIRIPVKPTITIDQDSPFLFKPALLIISPNEVDMSAGTCIVDYRLTEDVEYDSKKWLLRNWADSGQVIMPLAVISQAVQNGQLNVVLINSVLAGFNLEVDTDKL